ncbi:VOC family protein [Streptomyces prasinus]|uniref:Uncharacterized protein n=1 Tax=Streptomyces prasinus TaxID=67345 RepID=A0ABX6B704_9ACTN|nr:hypothetical protein [Streptomyces prasinus]QEV09921.1 hypothetical protein CP972_33785 [Streptomyces prasinus]
MVLEQVVDAVGDREDPRYPRPAADPLQFVTLGTRDLPTPRSFHRSWDRTERDGGDDGFAQSDAGGARLALYPQGLLRDEAAPGSELPPEDAGNGVTPAIDSVGREAVDTSAPLPWRPVLGS